MEEPLSLCHSHGDLPKDGDLNSGIEVSEQRAAGPQHPFFSDLGFPGSHFTLSRTLVHINRQVVVGLGKLHLPAGRLPLLHGVMAGEVLQALHSTSLIPLCLYEIWKRRFRKGKQMSARPPHGLDMAKWYPFADQIWKVNTGRGISSKAFRLQNLYAW